MRISRPSFLQKDKYAMLSLIAVSVLLLLSIFFKGGKSLEVTWLLAGVSWFCGYTFWSANPKTKYHVPLWLWCFVISYVILTILSYLDSSVANYGLDEVFRTGALVFVFLWVGRTYVAQAKVKSMNAIEVLLLFLAYSTVAACIIGIAVYTLQPVNRFVGTFFDHRFHTDYWPNAWGEFILAAWPSVVWWLGKADSRVSKKATLRSSIAKKDIIAMNYILRSSWLIRALIVGFVFGCFLLSYSRGSFIAFAGQLILWISLLAFQKPTLKWWAKKAFFVVCSLLIAGFVFVSVNSVRSQNFDVVSVEDKVTFTAHEGKTSVSERSQFWNQAIELTTQKPLLGWGPYSFRFVQPRLQSDVLASSDHAHNVFLKLSMERGVLTSALFGVIVFLLLIHTFFIVTGLRLTKKPTIFSKVFSVKKHLVVDERKRQILIVALLSVAGVLAHNLIDYNLQFVGIALPFWILLGVMSSVLYEQEDDVTMRHFLFGTELLLMSGILFYAILETDPLILSSMGRHAEQRGSLPVASYWYELSHDQRFSRDLHLSRAGIAIAYESTDDAKLALTDYFRQNIQDARAWKLRGDTCRLEADYECALVAYEQAYKLNRYNDLSITRWLVQTLVDLDRKDLLDQRRSEIENLLNDFQFAVMNNVHHIALSYNVEELIALTNILAEVYPDAQPMYVTLGAKIDTKSKQEREKYTSRPGYLW